MNLTYDDECTTHILPTPSYTLVSFDNCLTSLEVSSSIRISRCFADTPAFTVLISLCADNACDSISCTSYYRSAFGDFSVGGFFEPFAKLHLGLTCSVDGLNRGNYGAPSLSHTNQGQISSNVFLGLNVKTFFLVRGMMSPNKLPRLLFNTLQFKLTYT